MMEFFFTESSRRWQHMLKITFYKCNTTILRSTSLFKQHNGLKGESKSDGLKFFPISRSLAKKKILEPRIYIAQTV